MRVSIRLSAAVLAVAAGVVGLPARAPAQGMTIAGSEPQAAATPGSVTVAAGRFVPLDVAGGKPALVLGNEAGLLEMFDIPASHSVLGIRFDEPAGAKAKRYTFKTPVTIALAGDKSGTVTLTSVVNGADASKPPTVAGKLVLTLTAPQPPPGPDPKPPPPPPPPVTKSFRVVMVYETGKTMPAAQQAVLNAKSIEDYLIANTTPENGLAGFRRYDKDQQAEALTPGFAALWAAVKPQVTTVPCWAIEKDGKVDIVPWPANTAEGLALAKKYKEGK